MFKNEKMSGKMVGKWYKKITGKVLWGGST